MPVDVDRYPDLGARRRFATFEELLAAVREVHPGAYAEGSTGSERTFYVGRSPDDTLVAHGWSPRGRLDSWFGRIATMEAAPGMRPA